MYFCISVFFFKQKTAYEMRISDWSSDVCSSDLLGQPAEGIKETPDVAAQRTELTKNSSMLDAQIKLARLIAVEAQQASDQILKLRRTQFQAELGVRTDSILARPFWRSEEHTSELQSLMRISYAVFCLKKKNNKATKQISN